MVKMAGCDSGEIMQNKLSIPMTQRDFPQIFRAMQVGHIAEGVLFCGNGLVVSVFWGFLTLSGSLKNSCR